MTAELQFAALPGLRMGYVKAGPASGIPVLLLHGFPEFHHSWRHQIPALADAGYRVIAPDQRGYNLTEKHGPYDLRSLTQDVANLQTALGISSSHVVGHDWGGVVSYEFAHRFPERVRKLTILNVPHLNAYLDSMRAGNKAQRRKSRYVLQFQIPFLPERAFRKDNFAIAQRLFGNVRGMTGADLALYRAAYAQPGALSAMIGWYRALGRYVLRHAFRPPAHVVSAPTRVIWGDNDLALEFSTNDTLKRYVPNAAIVRIPGANHFVQMDAPDEVNRLLLDWLRA